MITADKLKVLTSYNASMLGSLLKSKGKFGDFDTVGFLGITNGSQFCYKVTYLDESYEKQVASKVFITCDSAGNIDSVSY